MLHVNMASSAYSCSLCATMHKKKKSLSLFYLSAISCYRLENRWKELNKADLQQIATIFQNYICFSYVRAWLVIV